MSSLKLFALGMLTLLAFAGNSILNRYALIDSGSEPWSFTVIRLVSGAAMLAALTGFQYRGGTWKGAIALLSYAAFFSYAYMVLDAGLGALILFTWVQLTMLGRAAAIGEQFTIVQWAGTILAFLALAWLLWPSENAITTGYSSILALGAMSFAGISWGIYSLIGRGATDPIAETSGNFSRATLIALIASVPVLLIRPETPAQYARLCGSRHVRRADLGLRLCCVVFHTPISVANAGGRYAIICAGHCVYWRRFIARRSSHTALGHFNDPDFVWRRHCDFVPAQGVSKINFAGPFKINTFLLEFTS